MRIIREQRRKGTEGLSLVELLVTVFVLSVGVLSAIMFYTNAMRATEFARDITLATTHGDYLFEEMQTRPSLSNITGTNWDTWAQTEGIKTLPSETISVTYANATAVPLEVSATVSWEKYERQNNLDLETKITK